MIKTQRSFSLSSGLLLFQTLNVLPHHGLGEERDPGSSSVIIGRAGQALLSDWLTVLTHYSPDGIAALLLLAQLFITSPSSLIS